MSRQLSELEALLQQMIVEHRKLLGQVAAHQSAMRVFDLKAMDAAAGQQEASRLRIATMEIKRRQLTDQLVRGGRPGETVTLSRLIELYPQRASALRALRDELRTVVGQVREGSHVAGRLAAAVLGHLNTAVRLLAGVVEKAGLYTKQGVPKMSARIGMMEAVG